MFFFSTVTSLTQLREHIDAIDKPDDLTQVRDVVRGYKGNHPLKSERYGFAATYKLLDNRANELGFIKYDFGYRKPLKTN